MSRSSSASASRGTSSPPPADVNRRAGEIERSAEEYWATTTALDQVTSAVDDALDQLTAEVRIVAQRTIDEAPLASYLSRADLRQATESEGAPEPVVENLLAQIENVRTEQADAAAAPQHPLDSARSRVEDFVRSIAGAIDVDVLWSTDRSGYRGGAMLYPDENVVQITLSDAVASAWPSTSARAFAAHAMGLGTDVSAACAKIATDPIFDGDPDAWASAWAASLGYRPADSRATPAQVSVAAGCRP